MIKSGRVLKGNERLEKMLKNESFPAKTGELESV